MTSIQFVDANDEPIGGGTKDEAHENGIRRRVIRIFLVNERREVLLQKRSEKVSAGAGKWDDSVAGHVDLGESYHDAAVRELQEEMGVANIDLTEVAYYYKEDSTDAKGWKGFQRVYLGKYDGPINPNPEEISETQWISVYELEAWMARDPDAFTKGCRQSFKVAKMLI